MVSKIINLTRKELPRISANSRANIDAINSLPEMVLHRMSKEGNKSILHCDMNQSVAGIISPNGINTVYTNALHGCNSCNVIAKLQDNRFVSILSHYVPTNVDGQINAIEKQLKTYQKYFDNKYQPRVFLNIRDQHNGLKPDRITNPIIEKLQNLLSKFFPQGNKTTITPYQNKDRPAFFSSANIFQFDPDNISSLKVTNVGEKELFVNL